MAIAVPSAEFAAVMVSVFYAAADRDAVVALTPSLAPSITTPVIISPEYAPSRP